jgi:hypothetical protein
MKNIFFAFLLLILFPDLTAQVLKGTIKNTAGEPLAYSTVYIRELQQGTTTNTKGNYEIRLPDGKYTVIFQSLGFAPDIREITIFKNIVNINITLQVQYYEIPEVRITATGEDPAYGIMRKVIGLAPYYLNQVSSYKAEVYLKGNLVINKIPKLLQKAMKVEARDEGGNSVSSTKMKAGDSYLMESVNELEFHAPDKYIQKVLSFQSTFPAQGNEISPMDFIQASFYQPVIADMAISPLSPEAFFHYNFKYLGSSSQGNFMVNKIQVLPKRKSQQLFEGTLFIIEDLWCLHSIDLANENIAGKVRIQQVFIPVKDDIWMPVSHKFEIAISIMGVKADAGYGSSIKYSNVNPNTALKKPQNISVFSSGKVLAQNTPADTSKTKTRKQIDKILTKKELTNRDMMKLSGLLDKESKDVRSDSSKKSLEIKESVTHIIEKDASKKDSAYWAEIRPIPLSEAENKSFRLRDSIKTTLLLKKGNADSTKKEGKEKSMFIKAVREIGLGHTWSDTSGFRFENNGLIKLRNLSYNTVDGFVYGMNFRFSNRWKKGDAISLSPEVRYAFSRQQLMASLVGNYRLRGLSQRYILFSAGKTSRDINKNGGIDPLLNSVSTLFLKRNYMKLYESSYLTTGFNTEIVNGLNANISLSFEDRRILSNTTDFSIIRSSREFSENIPDNQFLNKPIETFNLLQSQRHANLSVQITYTPRQKYRVYKEAKYSMGSDWPTFTFIWKHGVNEFTKSASPWKHFDMIRIGASKRKEIGAFGEFYWLVRGGGFLNNKNVPFLDYFHFNTQQLPVLLNSSREAFMLPAYYSLSTPEFYTEGHVKYTTPYLLLKLLPGLSNTLIRENLSASVLWSRYQKCYTEIGYSLSEVFFLGELGVYAGFDNYSFKSIGAKLVLKFN